MEANILSYIYILIIIIIGFILTNRLVKEKKTKLIYLVYLEHLFFTYVYYLYSSNNSADANMYFSVATFNKNSFVEFGTGTDFIIYLASFFVKLGFNKLALFYLFGFFGYIGFIYFMKMINIPSSLKIFSIPISTIILLLPEFHFWTSALGKDSLMFLALMLFFWNYKKFPKNILNILLSILLIFLIRPHMGFIIMASVIISLLFKNPTKFKAKDFVLILIAVVVLLISLPFLKSFLNIDQFELEQMNERFNSFTNYGANQVDELNSYVDVRSYSLPLKMFAYFFRPLFFDAHSLLQLLASIENFIILLIIFKWLKTIKFNLIKWYRSLNNYDKTIFVYVIMGWIILSMGMYNLGLASRQKYMLLPLLFYLIINHNYIYKRIK